MRIFAIAAILAAFALAVLVAWGCCAAAGRADEVMGRLLGSRNPDTNEEGAVGHGTHGCHD